MFPHISSQSMIFTYSVNNKSIRFTIEKRYLIVIIEMLIFAIQNFWWVDVAIYHNILEQLMFNSILIFFMFMNLGRTSIFFTDKIRKVVIDVFPYYNWGNRMTVQLWEKGDFCESSSIYQQLSTYPQSSTYQLLPTEKYVLPALIPKQITFDFFTLFHMHPLSMRKVFHLPNHPS